MTPDQKNRVAHEAYEAALRGISIRDGCPYPYASDEGRHWVAVWTLTFDFKQGGHDDHNRETA